MSDSLTRTALTDVLQWARLPKRKPLIIRGARQVGKSTLVKMLAEKEKLALIVLDFERKPELARLFASQDPRMIIQLISLQVGSSIKAGSHILFLDEIQAAPQILATLRYFYEEIPELHVICAGSLLEFALEKISFSMPVGRIEYLYLGPMTFEEFLLAMNEDLLLAFLSKHQLHDVVPASVHEKLLNLLKIFFIVGGMPEAVQQYVSSRDFMNVERTKHSILSTYQDDFSKYAEGLPAENRLREVFEKIPQYIACKVKYSQINPDVRSVIISDALKKLSLAKIIHLVHHSACNGIPLGAETNEKIFKPIFLDVGLLATQLNFSLLDLADIQELDLVNSGVMAEQFVGQHLLYDHPRYELPTLYYWQREKKSSQAEIDYMITQRQQIIPIEVKAGKTGTLKSLHTFLGEKKVSIAVRLNSQPPSLSSLGAHGATILSLPLYMVGQLRRLLHAHFPLA